MYYENSIMLVKVDDEFSSIFIPKLGVRQGGFASPKLFAIFIEDVVTSVDNTSAGIQINNTTINKMMYADDIIVVATNKKAIQETLNCVGMYGTEHGIKFNPAKAN
jgi:hypothetical protein